MSMDFVRKTYGVPAKRGARVRYHWTKGSATTGRVVYATNYVHVRFPGDPQIYRFHPTDESLDWLPNEPDKTRADRSEAKGGPSS